MLRADALLMLPKDNLSRRYGDTAPELQQDRWTIRGAGTNVGT
jgi:hypothetical protein